MKTPEDINQEAISFILDWGFIGGGHHKQWIIDQVLRILSGDNYEKLIEDYCKGEDGPFTYSWEEGIPP